MRISASEPVQIWLRGLPPEPRLRIRRALKALAAGKHRTLDIKPLRGELEGWCRLRVGDYRIIYRLAPGPTLQLDYADVRDVVYDIFRALRALREHR